MSQRDMTWSKGAVPPRFGYFVEGQSNAVGRPVGDPTECPAGAYLKPWNWAHYPEDRLADEVTPWLEMSVNAREELNVTITLLIRRKKGVTS